MRSVDSEVSARPAPRMRAQSPRERLRAGEDLRVEDVRRAGDGVERSTSRYSQVAELAGATFISAEKVDGPVDHTR
jgi:hypothetical protein